MATRTKPLISAAALASAAAVAVVSPGVAPNLNMPTPGALSRAAYELVNFKDVLSVPSVAWTDLLFGNTSWGGVLGPENYGPDWAAPQDAFGQYGYVNPWAAYCANTCDQSGFTGAAYLFFDALINGNGEGYANSDQWKIGFVNYFFEPNSVFQLGGGSSPTLQYVSEGLSAAAWYALQGTIGRLVPATSVPLAAAFWGPNNVSVLYNFTLSIAAVTLGAIPLVGPLLGNTLLAYLGDLSLEPGTQDYYQYGLSGAFNYLVDLATGAVPFPTKVPWYKIDPATAAAVATAASAVKTESADESATDDIKPETEGTDSADHEAAEASEVSDSTTEADSHDATEASHDESTETEAAETGSTETGSTETKADDTPVVAEPKADVPVATPPVETPVATTLQVPAADVAVSAPAEAPAAPKRPRPIRDAVEKAGKQINTAIANAKAAKAERVAARKAKVKAGAAE